MKSAISKKRTTNLLILLLLCAIWFAIGWLVCTWRLGTEVKLVEQVRRQLAGRHH